MKLTLRAAFALVLLACATVHAQDIFHRPSGSVGGTVCLPFAPSNGQVPTWSSAKGCWDTGAGGGGGQLPSDWNAVSGVTRILNKPALGGAALLNVGTGAGTVAAGNHTHAGVYEPIDTTILRQANLAGSGTAITPAHSDHTHTGVYEPIDANLLRKSSLSATNPLSYDSATGIFSCPSCGVSTGLSSLHGLSATTQLFSATNDTNVLLTLGTSGTDTHTFVMGWTGTLAKARQHAATLYSDVVYGDPPWIQLTATGGRITGLGGAAVLSVGTTPGTVAAGDDSRIAGAAQRAASNTFTTGTQDFTGAAHTLMNKTGLLSTRPSACTVGEEFFATDASAGANKYLCTTTGSPGTWTQQTGGTLIGFPTNWTATSNLSSTVPYSPNTPGACNVKGFGAIGDGSHDDTVNIQRAIDFCFGTAGSPHGGAGGQYANNQLYFPPGHYKTTSALVLTYVIGVTIQGAGRHTTTIENVTSGGTVLRTNGLSYSQMNGISLKTNGAGIALDLDWDGGGNSAGLQSDKFSDMFFVGDGTIGSYGTRIGHSAFMGSEMLFENSYWILLSTCLTTENANALQVTVVGGNFQGCGIGIYVPSGSVPVISGVGFQLSSDFDIDLGAFSATDNCLIEGIRTESANFVRNQSGKAVTITTSSHTSPTGGGYFYYGSSGGPATLTGNQSLTGSVHVASGFTVIENSIFTRVDWISYTNPLLISVRGVWSDFAGARPAIFNERIAVDSHGSTFTSNVVNAYAQTIDPGATEVNNAYGTLWLDTTDSNNYITKIESKVGGSQTWATIPTNATQLGSMFTGCTGGNIYLASDGTCHSGGSVAPLVLGTNVVSQRNGTNPQNFDLYGTYVDGSNYSKGYLQADYGAQILRLGSVKTGSPNLMSVISIEPNGVSYSFDSTSFSVGAITMYRSGGVTGLAQIYPTGVTVNDGSGGIDVSGSGAGYGLLNFRNSGGSIIGVVGNSNTDMPIDIRAGADFIVKENGVGTYLRVAHTTGILKIQENCRILTGSGSPESAVTGNVCDLYLRTNGGAATTLYVKESGSGNTGWIGK